MTHEKLTARRLAAAGVAIAGLALTACGSVAAPAAGGSGSGGSSATATATATATAAPPQGSLSITVLNGPNKKIQHWTLQCDPAGGTHPDPARACAALEAIKDPFAQIRTGQECPMILASSRRATFVGTWFGAKVDRTIVDGGCDLANWSKLGQVLN
jgi:subtilisin inhibitor-like